MPFLFVADDAFPLVDRILKPYTPPRGRCLTDSEKNFNYRRARRCVENAFGILTAKFVCLGRTMFCSPERAQKIVSACCVLHNYFLRTLKGSYCPSRFADSYDENGQLIEGLWRSCVKNTTHLDRSTLRNLRVDERAKQNREIFKNFVDSPEGSLSWQRRAVFLE